MNNPSQQVSGLPAQHRLGDAILLVALGLYVLGAVVLGWWFNRPELSTTTTVLLAVGLALPGVLGFVALRGHLAARLLITFSLVALVALHIHTAMGMLEFHFGVFVTLALLLVYLDWRPIVFAAALFAVHHMGFDRLQAMGVGVYCLSEPNFGIILLHALYVVVQTALQVFLVLRLAASVRDNAEVAVLASGIRQGEQISLDTRQAQVRAPLALQLRDNLDRMAQAVATVRNAVDSVLSASQEIAGGNRDLSQRTEQAASSLQQTAASLEQLTAGVQHSADAAAQAREMVAQAASQAQRGGQEVGQLSGSMAQIHQSSERIREIIGVIDGIAFQTNILALNASVEAARAGEQGRGFAVVAAEVRTLAQRSAQAAREIKDLINVSVERVQTGNDLVGRAALTMQSLVDSVQRVNGIMADIAAAAQEQSAGIGQVNIAVSHLDAVTQQNAALVEQSTAATESLSQQAQRLEQAVSVFLLGEAAKAVAGRSEPPRQRPAALRDHSPKALTLRQR